MSKKRLINISFVLLMLILVFWVCHQSLHWYLMRAINDNLNHKDIELGNTSIEVRANMSKLQLFHSAEINEVEILATPIASISQKCKNSESENGFQQLFGNQGSLLPSLQKNISSHIENAKKEALNALFSFIDLELEEVDFNSCKFAGARIYIPEILITSSGISGHEIEIKISEFHLETLKKEPETLLKTYKYPHIIHIHSSRPLIYAILNWKASQYVFTYIFDMRNLKLSRQEELHTTFEIKHDDSKEQKLSIYELLHDIKVTKKPIELH